MIPGTTPLYGSMNEVIGRLAGAASDAVRLVLVVSDGLPEKDPVRREDAVRAAQSAGIALYPALVGSYRSKWNPDYTDRRLAELQTRYLDIANQTGGQSFEFDGANPSGLLDRILKRLAAEIRYDYIAGYYPAEPAGAPALHKVQVVLKNSSRGKVIGGARDVRH